MKVQYIYLCLLNEKNKNKQTNKKNKTKQNKKKDAKIHSKKYFCKAEKHSLQGNIKPPMLLLVTAIAAIKQ